MLEQHRRSSFDDSIDNKKYKVSSLNPRPHEAQLEDKNPKKVQEGHLEEGKITRPTKGTKSGKTEEKSKKNSNSKTHPEINFL
jgi:hypothetical protein